RTRSPWPSELAPASPPPPAAPAPSAPLPPINSPPMFPQPKPSADTRSPVPPSDRCSISHLLLLIYGPRTAHGSFYAPTSAVNRAGTNFPLDGGFAGRDKRGHSMSRFPVITPPALAELRARIGRPVPRPAPYLEVATRAAVREAGDPADLPDDVCEPARRGRVRGRLLVLPHGARHRARAGQVRPGRVDELHARSDRGDRAGLRRRADPWRDATAGRRRS